MLITVTSSKFYMLTLTPNTPAHVDTDSRLSLHLAGKKIHRHFAELDLDVGVYRNECFHSGLFGDDSKSPKPRVLPA